MVEVDLEAIRREHRQRLFDRYEKEAAAFSRLFTALLVFSAFFLAFALVPYAVLQHNRQLIARDLLASSRRLEEARQEVEVRRRQLTALEADVGKRAQVLASLVGQVAVTEQKARELAEKARVNESAAAEGARQQERSQGALAALREAQGRIAATPTDPEATVRDLRSYLGTLAGDRDALRPDAACPQTDRSQLMSCRVGAWVRVRIAELFQPLEQNVIPAIAPVDGDAAGKLRQRLETLRRNLERRPLDKPDFWRTVDEKYLFSQDLERDFRPVLQELRQVATRAMDDLTTQMDDVKETVGRLRGRNTLLAREIEASRANQAKLSQERERLEAEVTVTTTARVRAEAERKALEDQVVQIRNGKQQLEDAQKASRDQQDEIAKRLSSIQSPFGTLPIGLREGILSFPLVIAVAYLLGAGSLAEAIRLRGTCHRLYREWDQRGQIVTDGQVALFAPLWVDPALPARRQVMAIALLLLPVPIFLVAIGLIGYISLIAEAPPLRGGTAWVLYTLGSAAALGALLVALARIRAAWRTYPQVASPQP